MKQRLSSRMYSTSRVYGLAMVVVALGMSLQWLLLSGTSPLTMGATLKRLPQLAQTGAFEGHEAIAPIRRPEFQTGMIFPRWGTIGYSTKDTNWLIGLKEIHAQTAARWVEVTINLYQQSLTSTDILRAPYTPTPEAVAQGIRWAHAMHYHVFVTPLLTVGNKRQWCGDIQFATTQQAQSWFDSYWSAFRPYVAAAAQAGAEQLAIGTEYEKLQSAAPSLWERLIERAATIFPGKLTYDINWSSLNKPLPSWIDDSRLSYVGVSVYFPLSRTRRRLDPDVILVLWQEKIRSRLDAFAKQLGKPIVISEIGYRDRADALYNPWERDTPAAIDPEEQAAAYWAALSNVLLDPHINGIFFWAWSFNMFEPNWRPAAQALHMWYTAVVAF